MILISHTARTSFAMAAREAALASSAQVVSITGIGGGWQADIRTVSWRLFYATVERMPTT